LSSIALEAAGVEFNAQAEIAGDVSVRALTDADMARWDEFVLACPKATFFHRAGWKTVMEKAFGHRTHFLLAESNGHIVGVLPLAEVKSWLFGHSLCSLPFCVYGGIVATSQQARSALDQAAQNLAAKLNVDHLEYRSFAATHSDWAHKDLYVTFRKELFTDHEQNMLAIPRKQRAMVRKGIKAELRGEIDQTADRFFALFSDNVHRHGTPALSKRYFQILMDVFGRDCEVLTVESPDHKPLSSVLTFYFRNEVLPYYAGDDLTARDYAANDFKYWDLMQRAVNRGCTLFDYGRSKIGTGPYHFKKNWGFEPTPLSYEYQLHRAKEVPDQNPLNPKYRLFIKAWQTMPLALANQIGPHIVKYLG
jgi:FemAB-related protein (PEP-CTERM system-associated)